MAENVRIYSILPVLGHPRDSKRIAMLQKAGFRVEAAAFQRDYHAGRPPGCTVELLGQISHGQYFKRLLKLIKVVPVIRRGMRRNDVVYTSGPDMALLALLSGIGLGKPIFVEVGDLREIQVANSLKGWVARLVDKLVVSACAKLVVTAPGFSEEYYGRRLKVQTPTLLLENKLEAEDGPSLPLDDSIKPAIHEGSQRRRLRIGYFGVLRCEWSWRVLEACAREFPDRVEIVLAGHPMCAVDIASGAKALNNVKFLGPYQSPGDLPALYRDVDIVWACYPGPDTSDPAWRWAQAICRSNRFYESCRFRRPIVCVRGSGDAAVVERFDIGLILDDQSTAAVLDALQQVQPADLERWRANLNTLPRNTYEYTSEISELKHAVREVVAA